MDDPAAALKYRPDIDGLRARRIFPALFFMFALCALFALGFVLSSDLAAFGDSLAAANLFVGRTAAGHRPCQFEGSGIRYFSLYRAICPGESCRRLDERGMPLSFDYGHFTESGSIFIARQLRQAGVLDARAPQARSN